MIHDMIQVNIPQKLSLTTLIYMLFRHLITYVIIFLIAYFLSLSPQFIQYKSLVIGGATFLLVFSFLFTILYWKLFEYTIGDSYIKVHSGVIFRSEKNINFNDIQSANAVFGPLLAIFGLKEIRGFTSSPGQLIISSRGNSGIQTQHVPDIEIILDKQTAQELLEMMRKGDIQKVQSV